MLIGNMFFYKNKSVLNALGIVKHFTTHHYALKHVTVALDCGKLRGIKSKLWNGSTYYSFKGIPYAQPPVGKLRFKAPLPPEPWQGTYDAFEHGPICPQIKTNDGDIHKSNEDCLYLNVYTKSLDRNSKLPVMILIHAGAYLSGSGNTDIYGPDFLLQHDVLLVTFNYRLEALGFLCLDTPEIPGNAGMKDQIAAFRWVQRNIANLGGDPNNVTIFGGSAGGTSVTYHLLSPLSTGLFHKAIAQSGVCLADWAQGKNGKDRAIRAAKYLGQETNNISELTDLFQSIPVEKLVKITFKSMTEDEKHRGYPTHFVPVVEKEFENVEAFITKEPIDLLFSGQINKVPLIIGYNSSEGLFTTPYQIEKINFMNNHLSYYVPREIANVVSTGKLVDFGNRIRRFYAGDRKLTEEDVDIIMNLHSDIHFVYNCHRFCQFYSTRCESIFTYRFDCVTDLNVQKKSLGFEHCRGACHVDELYYLFKNDMNKDAYEKQEKLREIVFKMTKLWTDFAKTGNQTPKNTLGFNWTPYTRRGKEYLNINDNIHMGTFADKERVEFWNSLYKEAGLPYISEY